MLKLEDFLYLAMPGKVPIQQSRPPNPGNNSNSVETAKHRLNIEISKVNVGSMSLDVHRCTHWPRPRNSPPPPPTRIWTRRRGRNWSAKIDDIFL